MYLARSVRVSGRRTVCWDQTSYALPGNGVAGARAALGALVPCHQAACRADCSWGFSHSAAGLGGEAPFGRVARSLRRSRLERVVSARRRKGSGEPTPCDPEGTGTVGGGFDLSPSR